VTGFSNQLSTRYQRPEASIMIDVTHSACMMLAGSFEPTYTLTITALAANIQPATNKRNTALLQHWMEENLGVEPSRGVVKFVAVPEENLATNGVTVLGEIEALDKHLGFDNVGGLKRSLTRGRTINKGKKTSDSSSTTSSHSPFIPIRITPSPQLSSVSEDERLPPLPSMPNDKSKWDRRADKAQRIGRRRSIIEFFAKQK
jgi:Macrophage migration inhibitory factor (MIF)